MILEDESSPGTPNSIARSEKTIRIEKSSFQTNFAGNDSSAFDRGATSGICDRGATSGICSSITSDRGPLPFPPKSNHSTERHCCGPSTLPTKTDFSTVGSDSLFNYSSTHKPLHSIIHSNPRFSGSHCSVTPGLHSTYCSGIQSSRLSREPQMELSRQENLQTVQTYPSSATKTFEIPCNSREGQSLFNEDKQVRHEQLSPNLISHSLQTISKYNQAKFSLGATPDSESGATPKKDFIFGSSNCPIQSIKERSSISVQPTKIGVSFTTTSTRREKDRQCRFCCSHNYTFQESVVGTNCCMEDPGHLNFKSSTVNDFYNQHKDSRSVPRFSPPNVFNQQSPTLSQNRQHGETLLSSDPKEGEGLSKRLLQDTEIVGSSGTISTGSTTTSRVCSPVLVDIRNKPTVNIPVEEDNSFRQEASKVRNGNQSPGRRRGSRPHRNCLNINSPTLITNSNLPPLQYDTSLLQSILLLEIHTVKSFSKQLRLNISRIFTSHLNKITNSSTISDWIQFLILPKCLLQSLPPGDKAYKLSSRKRKAAEREFSQTLIHKWEESVESRDSLIRDLLSSQNTRPRPQSRRPCSEFSNIQRCTKIAREDGNFGKAIKSLQSHGVAPQGPVTNQILQDKHPSDMPLPKATSQQHSSHSSSEVLIDKEEVLSALRSFPKGTGCGKTGLRVSHILEMYGGENLHFLNAFTSFIQLLANGKAPSSLAPFIASASLIPILKKDNVSVRPIAVGEVIRRITSKILMAKIKDMVADYLKPMQVGVGVPNGTEAILNGLNRLIDDPNLNPDTTILLIDYVNAFNMVHRQPFIDEIHRLFPQLSAWVEFIYCCAALLFTPDGKIIYSIMGVQQGDPLGPLLFALVLQILLIRIQKKGITSSISSFLDDLTIVAPNLSDALVCLQEIKKYGPELGLHYSHLKSLVWQPRKFNVSIPSSNKTYSLLKRIKSFATIHTEDGLPLLGGSITRSSTYAATVATQRANKVVKLITTLLTLKDPQLCLTLMRVCAGMCKMIYSFRTTHPSALNDASKILTSALHQALSKIVVGIGPFFGDFQLQLASLPVRYGGLGITIPSDIAPFAHLASSLDTWSLQSVIFPTLSADTKYIHPLVNHFLQIINKKDTQVIEFLDTLPLLNTHHFLADMYFKNKRQLVFSHPYLSTPLCSPFATQHRLILQSNSARPYCTDKTSRPKFSSSFASQWLFAMPNSRLGQTMPPFQYQAALRFRLLIPFRSQSTICSRQNCSSQLDPFGYHSLSCGGIGSLRTARHETLVRALTDLAQVSGFCPTMNAPVQCLGGTSSGNHYFRPADILINGDYHQRLCIDCTIVSPLSESKSSTKDGNEVGFLVNNAANLKMKKHADACSAADLGFTPFAVDVCGVVDLDASNLISRFASAYSKIISKSYAYALQICRRRISFALQIGISAQLSCSSAVRTLSSLKSRPNITGQSSPHLEQDEILFPYLGDND